MHILVVGLNYRTAPVEIREKFAIAETQMPQALAQLKQINSLLECVIVGTCNRTELYAVVDRVKLCGQSIIHFMEQWFDVPRAELVKHLYVYEDHKAIRHLFRVTCGLDSMIIGETQILGQVRDAFLKAQTEKATGTIFNTLFKQSVTLGKRAHSETAIGENPVSVSYAAVELGKRIFGDFSGKTVMIVGAGKMSELTVKHLYASGAEKVIVINRTLSKAQELADKFGGAACTMDHIAEQLVQADIVISSTGASGYVLTRNIVKSAMKVRKSRPLFMIDIAVPRDLEPSIGDVDNVYLYDIDSLQSIVDSNVEERQREALKIDDMIDAELQNYEQWYNTLGVGPVIKALKDKSNRIHEETMESLMNKLPHLSDRDMKVIRKLTKSIVNQILRDPILSVKELAAERKGDEAVELFTQMFALEESVDNEKTETLVFESDKKKNSANTSGPQASVSIQPNDLLAGT